MTGVYGAKENPAGMGSYAGVYGSHENFPEVNSSRQKVGAWKQRTEERGPCHDSCALMMACCPQTTNVYELVSRGVAVVLLEELQSAVQLIESSSLDSPVRMTAAQRGDVPGCTYLIVALDGVHEGFIGHNLGLPIEESLEPVLDCLQLLLADLRREKENFEEQHETRVERASSALKSIPFDAYDYRLAETLQPWEAFLTAKSFPHHPFLTFGLCPTLDCLLFSLESRALSKQKAGAEEVESITNTLEDESVWSVDQTLGSIPGRHKPAVVGTPQRTGITSSESLVKVKPSSSFPTKTFPPPRHYITHSGRMVRNNLGLGGQRAKLKMPSKVEKASPPNSDIPAYFKVGKLFMEKPRSSSASDAKTQILLSSLSSDSNGRRQAAAAEALPRMMDEANYRDS
ncbi:hypothetical protein U0070_006302 [Myodes glareolus]|uniref:Uncharacterized protein n=1 Tax=Myodes glareolus TaxID=447135 RepID=A0AAW0J170_MYOGA